MRELPQPWAGRFIWIYVPGGRALHVVTHDSHPRTLCERHNSVTFTENWRPGRRWMRSKGLHSECIRLLKLQGLSPYQINDWPEDEELRAEREQRTKELAAALGLSESLLDLYPKGFGHYSELM